MRDQSARCIYTAGHLFYVCSTSTSRFGEARPITLAPDYWAAFDRTCIIYGAIVYMYGDFCTICYIQSLTKLLERWLISRRPPPPFQCCEEKRENTTHIRADVRSSDPKCQINIERGKGGCWIFFLNLNVKQGVVRCAFQLLLSLIVDDTHSNRALFISCRSLNWESALRNAKGG